MTEIITKEQAIKLIKKYEYLKENNYNFYNELAKMDNKGKGINEACHSKIIAHLLNAKNNECAQYYFLKNFIKFLENLNEYRMHKFMKLFTNDLIVETEYNINSNKKIDIFMYSKNASFVCVIENKIDGELGKDQLKTCSDFINNSPDFSNYKHKHFVYLRRYLDKKTSSDNVQISENNYQEIEYSDIAKMIDSNVLGNCENEKMHFNILQYKEFLDLYWYETIDGNLVTKLREMI